MRRRNLVVSMVVACMALAAGCASDDSGSTSDTTAAATSTSAGATTTAAATTTSAGSGAATTRKVPQDYATIQEAVDAAQPGDLVLVDAGTYHEAVTVGTDNLVIRGVDRNKVVLDGQFTLENGIRIVGSNGVAVENMTAMNYKFNGFFWTGVKGFRGSYLTAIRNGDYGIYAFDSSNGLFEHSLGTGSPDAGFYVGQCNPCNVVLDDVIGERNGLGYSGTNASVNLTIANSTFRFNRAGIVPNSGDGEKLAPQSENVIVGNLVYSNNNPDTPAIDAATLAFGNGILVAGGNKNLIIRNRVWDHDISGIGLVPNADKNVYGSDGNTVKENDVSDSRTADLAMATDPSGKNCWAGNTFTSSMPAAIETAAPCEGAPTSPFDANPLPLAQLIARDKPKAGDYTKMPDPEPQPSMPDAIAAPVRPAIDLPPKIDVASIALPAKP